VSEGDATAKVMRRFFGGDMVMRLCDRLADLATDMTFLVK
jgi:hypothetical protein